MKLTKFRLQRTINNTNKQTRKKFKKHIKVLHHTNTQRNHKQFNLHNKSIRNWGS